MTAEVKVEAETCVKQARMRKVADSVVDGEGQGQELRKDTSQALGMIRECANNAAESEAKTTEVNGSSGVCCLPKSWMVNPLNSEAAPRG